MITGLWSTPAGSTFDFPGTYYPVSDSPALPKPVQRPRPPILLGGMGPKRTPRLAARYADEFNLPFVSVEDTVTQFQRVRDACAEIDRDPSTMAWSNALVLCCGRNEAEVKRRAEAIGRDPDELRANGAAGTPAEVVETLGRYAETGSSRAYLQVLDLTDLDHLELVAAEVMPHV